MAGHADIVRGKRHRSYVLCDNRNGGGVFGRMWRTDVPPKPYVHYKRVCLFTVRDDQGSLVTKPTTTLQEN